jgi:hypothetical protein
VAHAGHAFDPAQLRAFQNGSRIPHDAARLANLENEHAAQVASHEKAIAGLPALRDEISALKVDIAAAKEERNRDKLKDLQDLTDVKVYELGNPVSAPRFTLLERQKALRASLLKRGPHCGMPDLPNLWV